MGKINETEINKTTTNRTKQTKTNGVTENTDQNATVQRNAVWFGDSQRVFKMNYNIDAASTQNKCHLSGKQANKNGKPKRNSTTVTMARSLNAMHNQHLTAVMHHKGKLLDLISTNSIRTMMFHFECRFCTFRNGSIVSNAKSKFDCEISRGKANGAIEMLHDWWMRECVCLRLTLICLFVSMIYFIGIKFWFLLMFQYKFLWQIFFAILFKIWKKKFCFERFHQFQAMLLIFSSIFEWSGDRKKCTKPKAVSAN